MACCPVGGKKVWRRQCLLLQPVAIATAHLCTTILTLIATRHVTAPVFCPHFCDVFQVAGEGHYYFTLPNSLLDISGKIFFKKSDFLTFRLQKCFLPFCLYLQAKVSSQFVSDSIILQETAAGISFSKFRKQKGPQLEMGVGDESVQKHIHCVCL